MWKSIFPFPKYVPLSFTGILMTRIDIRPTVYINLQNILFAGRGLYLLEGRGANMT